MESRGDLPQDHRLLRGSVDRAMRTGCRVANAHLSAVARRAKAEACPPPSFRCVMETIGKQKIWSFLDRAPECRITTNTAIREGAGHKVGSYLELARKIAELQFLNRDHVLLFRGQGGDHRNTKGNTSVKP